MCNTEAHHCGRPDWSNLFYSAARRDMKWIHHEVNSHVGIYRYAFEAACCACIFSHHFALPQFIQSKKKKNKFKFKCSVQTNRQWNAPSFAVMQNDFLESLRWLYVLHAFFILSRTMPRQLHMIVLPHAYSTFNIYMSSYKTLWIISMRENSFFGLLLLRLPFCVIAFAFSSFSVFLFSCISN